MKLTHMVEVQCAGSMGYRLLFADAGAARLAYEALTAKSTIVSRVTLSDLVGEITLERDAVVGVRLIDLDADMAARAALGEREEELAYARAHPITPSPARGKAN